VNLLPSLTASLCVQEQGPAGSTGNRNYGWHCFEGTASYNNNPTDCSPSSVYTDPIFQYPQNNATGGFAVTGGYVYRGTQSRPWLVIIYAPIMFPAMHGSSKTTEAVTFRLHSKAACLAILPLLVKQNLQNQTGIIRLNTSGFSKGMYTVVISRPGRTVSKTFIVQ